MNGKSPPILFTLLLLSCGALLAEPITPEEAKSHAGQNVVVDGRVDEFHATARAAFLDMGGRYPNEEFSVVCFPSSEISAEELSKFDGEKISVSGRVALYHGKPEITVTSLRQISVR